MVDKCGKCLNFVERHCDNDATIQDEFSIINDTFSILEERVEKLEERVKYLEETLESEIDSYQHHICDLEDEEVKTSQLVMSNLE